MSDTEDEPAGTITIIRQQYAVSTGDMGDLFEFASSKETKQPVLFDDISEAAALAQVAANAERRPTRVLKITEVAFLRPQPLAKSAGSA